MTYEQWKNAVHMAKAQLEAAKDRYNDTVSGEQFGDLYGDDCEGTKTLLTYPVRWGRVVYFVTEDFPTVYKFNEATGKYRESKTAYRALKRCENAIRRARKRLEKVLDAFYDVKATKEQDAEGFALLDKITA